MSVTEKIMLMRDEKYRIFQSRLMPTVDKSKIIGVRTPLLRSLAKSLDEKEAKEFMSKLPHRYYEEDNLHAFLIERIKDFDECVAELDRFLPYVDNWATCDSMTPRILKSDLPLLLFHIDRWIDSGRCYAMRYGIGLMLKFYLEPDTFSAEHLSRAACVHSEEYYVKMMVAWYFATALAKQYEATLPYIEGDFLDEWTRRKTVQKARESLRISDERKKYLSSLI
jgi:3-methyladenine DNA glycosylase AlkD